MGEATTPSREEGGKRDVEPERKASAVHLFFMFSCMYVAFAVDREVVDALPAHPKQLAQAAVVTGAIGAVLLVRELMRDILRVRVLWLLVLVVGFEIAQIDAPKGIGAFMLQVGGSTFLLLVGMGLTALVERRAALIRSRLERRRATKYVGRYGILTIGVVLLVTSMLLQLRSIGLSRY